MILNKNNDDLNLMGALSFGSGNPMKFLVEIVLNRLMESERDIALKALPYERSKERLGYANGFKNKSLNTRFGELKLKVPQTRDYNFYPKSLKKGLRYEGALKAAISEMYFKGVSTRRVKKITQKLCGLHVTSTQVSRITKELDEDFKKFRNRSLGNFPYIFLDATYIKVRHKGSVRSQAVLMAYGVKTSGKREILGVSIALSESKVNWENFLSTLLKRGLSGVKLITSDDHSGLTGALQSMFPSTPWQRCQFHMSQNAQQYASKKDMKKKIALAMRNIFDAPCLGKAESIISQTVKQFKQLAPEFVKWLENNIKEGLTCLKFPQNHRKKIRTSNGIERINREVKRRTKVAVLFPNDASALRLVTSVLMEIHKEWIAGRQYLDMEEINSFKARKNFNKIAI